MSYFRVKDGRIVDGPHDIVPANPNLADGIFLPFVQEDPNCGPDETHDGFQLIVEAERVLMSYPKRPLNAAELEAKAYRLANPDPERSK